METSRLFVMHLLMIFMPPTRCFSLKRAFLRWAEAVVGVNVRIVSRARIFLTGELIISDETWIGHEVLIIGGDANVTIGSGVDITPRVSIITGTHERFTVPERVAGKGYSLPVDIEDGAWVGAGATILGVLQLENVVLL